jgi:hypothetical protein
MPVLLAEVSKLAAGPCGMWFTSALLEILRWSSVGYEVDLYGCVYSVGLYRYIDTLVYRCQAS